MPRLGIAAASVLTTLLLGRMPLFAQTDTGALTGTVYDQAGARLQQAAVAVRNSETGTGSEVSPSDKGEYRFENLPAGKYSIRASAKGLTTVQINDVIVQANKTSSINVTLPESRSSPISVVEVSEAPQPVEVPPAAPPTQRAPAPIAQPPQGATDDAKTVDIKVTVGEITAIRERLALSADQQMKVRTIFQNRQAQVAVIRGDNSLSPPDRREKIREARAVADTQLRALLNQNQLDEYDEILRERRERTLQRKQETAMASH